MRVASMVPSWTETLIEAGADVVARTRYCRHPASAARVPAIGGTKDIDWTKLAASRAQLMILDQEENPLAMAENSPCPYWASNITDVDSVAPALRELAVMFEAAGDEGVAHNLRAFARRWESVVKRLSHDRPVLRAERPPPGFVEWFREPAVDAQFEKSVYVIWKKPYMAAGRNTFIGSMLDLQGVRLEKFATKYPEIDLSMYDPATTLLLFSSEPFPFATQKGELSGLPFASALVDGESLSWFGVRSLRFLENLTGL